jgi:hypothetical protein
MPMFATGNAGWDQGLNSLAGSLFPDPSKQAQAGYYGAETAKTLLDAQRLRDEKGYRDSLARQYHLDGNGQPIAPATPPAAGPPPLADTVAPPGPQPLAITRPNLPPAGPAPPDTPSPGPPSAVTPAALNAAGPMPAPNTAPASAPPPSPTSTAPGGGVATMSLPQLIALSLLGGQHAPEASLLARAELVNRVRTGQIANDPAQINREQSALGDSQPLQSATTIQTTGMNNATTLANTRLQGQNAINLADNEIMSVVPIGQNVPVSRTKGYIKAHPEEFNAYDSARAVAGDTPRTVSSVPGSTTAPPVTVPQRDSYNRTPYDENQARDDAKPVTVIGPPSARFPNGRGTMTKGELRQNPQYTEENAPDAVIGTQATPEGPRSARAGGMANQGATPVPSSTDALNAQRQAEIADAIRRGDYDLAKTLTDAMQQATGATQPKGAVSQKESQATDRFLDDNFAKMFPVPARRDWGQTDLPATMDPATKAYATERMRELSLTDPRYRSDPNAAAIAVLEEMRGQGVWARKGTGDRNVGVMSGWGFQGADQLTGGDKPRYIVKGDLKGTGRPAAPPKQAGPRVAQPPPGALGPAPPGAVEGQTGTGPNGVKGIVRGGWMMPLQDAASGMGTGGGGG